MNKYRKPRMCLSVFLMLVVAGPSFFLAQASPLPTVLARQLVKETSERMLQTLGERKEELEKHPKQIYGLVKEILLPHFDFQGIARLALGKYWRQATAEQKRRFVGEFRTLLLRTYSTALLKYSDEKINYLPPRGPKKTEQTLVRMEIEQARGGPPISVDINLHEKGENWKVYDIKIDGVSLVTNYRTSFASEIRRGGLDQLIDKLEKKNSAIAS